MGMYIPKYHKDLWVAESRIINSDGLLNLFHGTYADFNNFDDKQIASNEAYDQDHRVLGHFLSSLSGAAELYGVNGYLYTVHLYSVNPKIIHFDDWNDFLKWNVGLVSSFQEEMREGGYDSIQAVCGKASNVWYIAPLAPQIQIITKERIYMYENRKETLFEM